MAKNKKTEALLWSIATPGLGQLFNHKVVKGIFFMVLELIINVRSHLNRIIISSFHGELEQSVKETDYQWLMFYPCMYMFAMWDAYKDAGGGTAPYETVPFIFGAFFGTVGLIYSPVFRVRGVLVGAVWLGIAGALIGVGLGLLARKWLVKRMAS